MLGRMTEPERVRLADLLAGLSVATDLGLGVPPETAVRVTLVAQAIAGELGLDAATRADLYYATLLRSVGCTGFAHELVGWFGDEFSAVRAVADVDMTRPGEALGALAASVRGAGRGHRTRALVATTLKGKEVDRYITRADCEGMAAFVRRFAVGAGVGPVLQQVFERWDGKGGPRGLAEEAIDVAARVMVLADQVVPFHRTGGVAGAAEMARRRSGGWFDPACVEAFLRCADDVLAVVGSGGAWEAALAAEPEPWVTVPPWGVDDVAAAFADFADMKSPYLLGHSPGVAELAVGAAERLGFAAADRTTLRRAALLHDLGRVAVSTRLWDKPGPLSPPEWEQVRLHAYHTERVLRGSPLLEPLAAVAGAHHERVDGSGYHRGVAQSSPAARLLAAADAFHAMTEPRPYREALVPEQAGAEVEAAGRAGILDADAVGAVCAVAGAPIAPVAREWPAGLTDREVDVLRLLARGRSKKEVAADLVIAPGTVHTHVTHLYQKTGVSTRAGIALYALEHRLL
jgi:HD-GYP domain-containing protein (c-di-GMP phosphodiesterase class II)/DNA-binding CsgD family transcriptional regulator